MFKIVNFKKRNVKGLPLQKVCLDFALAEFSSAIEMLYASKKVDNPNLAIGFLRHSLDEYRHTNFFKKLIVESDKSNSKDMLKFLPRLVYSKGFIKENKFLFDKMKINEFSVFIGVNEMQALKIFQKFKNQNLRLEDSIKKELDNIIKEESNHSLNTTNIFTNNLSDLIIDEEKHSRLALQFSKKNIKKMKYKFLYFKYLVFNKLRHFVANSEFTKKILSYFIVFFLILLTFPLKFALKTNTISNGFHLNKNDANLIL